MGPAIWGVSTLTPHGKSVRGHLPAVVADGPHHGGIAARRSLAAWKHSKYLGGYLARVGIVCAAMSYFVFVGIRAPLLKATLWLSDAGKGR